MKRLVTISLLVIWLLASLTVVAVVSYGKLRHLTEPLPLPRNRLPDHFYVVGVNRSEQPVLLEHSRSANDPESGKPARGSGGAVCWGADSWPGGPYSWYLPAKKQVSIEKSVNALLNDPLLHVEVRLLSDDPRKHRQTIRLDYDHDEFSYYCVYNVAGTAVYPTHYGDFTKRDAFRAFGGGVVILVALSLPALLLVRRVMRPRTTV